MEHPFLQTRTREQTEAAFNESYERWFKSVAVTQLRDLLDASDKKIVYALMRLAFDAGCACGGVDAMSMLIGKLGDIRKPTTGDVGNG